MLADRFATWVGEGGTVALSALTWAPAWALTPLALPLADLGVPPAIPMIVGGVLTGFFVIVYNVAQVSFRQRLCPPALLGRMNASVRFIVWGTVPLGGLLGGLLGTQIGVVPTLWVSVGGAFVAALPVLLSPLPRMRHLPGPDAVGPEASGGVVPGQTS